MVTPPPLTILHVTKYPPSPSGIALYAEVFDTALRLVGAVQRHAAPPDPRESQRFAAALRGIVRGWKYSRTHPHHLVQVELGGRALYEFYFALGAMSAGSRVTVTLHDLPSIVGPSLLFTGLDRRGLRRVGITLSRMVGKHLEQYLLRRSSAVFTLTVAGHEWLHDMRATATTHLGHIVDTPPRTSKQRLIFCPGYINDPEPIIELARLTQHFSPEWHVLVGACTGSAEYHIREAIHHLGLPASLTGHLDETTLLATFSKASLVVRVRSFAGANHLAASGPLAWAAARGCIVITNDDRPGARELEALGLVQVTGDWQRATHDALIRAEATDESSHIAGKAVRQLGPSAIAQRYAKAARIENQRSPIMTQS